MMRRCSACCDLFEVAQEPATVDAYRCAGCQRAALPPVPGWVEAWERSKTMQRDLREKHRAREEKSVTLTEI
jgi:hypothetical protein